MMKTVMHTIVEWLLQNRMNIANVGRSRIVRAKSQGNDLPRVNAKRPKGEITIELFEERSAADRGKLS